MRVVDAGPAPARARRGRALPVAGAAAPAVVAPAVVAPAAAAPGAPAPSTVGSFGR